MQKKAGGENFYFTFPLCCFYGGQRIIIIGLAGV
jgi:hypothetical protein